MEQIIIGIDHGNGNIKTKHCVFPCGFKRQDTKPSELFSTDILTYRGNYYSLTKSRFPYEIDKTKNENCLILTLFAIAKELKERAREEKKEFDWKTSFGNFIGKDVVLAVGLPPAHLEKQQESFKKYFLDAARYGIEFHYNGKLFQFHIKEVLIFPQDYAAAVIYREALIKKYSSVYCIDIGDGTVDLLALKNGIPDKEVMVSRELGMAGLRAKIIDDVINDFGMTIDAELPFSLMRTQRMENRFWSFLPLFPSEKVILWENWSFCGFLSMEPMSRCSGWTARRREREVLRNLLMHSKCLLHAHLEMEKHKIVH